MFVTENLKQDIMTTVNKFYTTYSDENNRHRFDIKELPPKMSGMISPIFYYSDGRSQGGKISEIDTMSGHYDYEFVQTLLQVNPIYEINTFLDHHYLKFGNRKSFVEKEAFVHHIRYSIYSRVKDAVGGQGSVVKDWTEQKVAEIQAIKSQKKAELLEYVYRHVKGGGIPQIYISELGRATGIDFTAVEQIAQELFSIGYIEPYSELNTITFSTEGLKYAERNFKESNTTNSLSIGTIGNNANVQLQLGANNSHQSQTITTSFGSEERDELVNFIRDLNHSLEGLKSYLQESEIRNLRSDLAYLENVSTRETTNNGTVKNLLKGIGGVLKKVPEKVITTIVTEYMKGQIF